MAAHRSRQRTAGAVQAHAALLLGQAVRSRGAAGESKPWLQHGRNRQRLGRDDPERDPKGTTCSKGKLRTCELAAAAARLRFPFSALALNGYTVVASQRPLSEVAAALKTVAFS
jgi:hypothetical protein